MKAKINDFKKARKEVMNDYQRKSERIEWNVLL